MDEISENIFSEELDKLVQAENSVQRKLHVNENKMEIQNLKRRSSEYAIFESHVSLNLKDDNYWKPINGQIKLSVREYSCVANWRWRIIFIKKATQEVAKKLKN